MRLPNLIFSENHADFVSRSILIKLVSEFKKLGYKTVGLEEAINSMTSLAQIVESTNKKFLEHENELQEMRNFIIEFRKDNDLSLPENANDLAQLEELKDTVELLHNVSRDRNKYYLALSNEAYDYFLIDDVEGTESLIAKIQQATNIEDLLNTNILEGEAADMRNNQMAKQLQSQSLPYFASIGKAHIKPIQENLIHSLSKEAVLKNYLFFQVDSWPLDVDLEKEYEPPIKPYYFKATEENEDEIVKEIMALVKNKIAAMQLYTNDKSALPFLGPRYLAKGTADNTVLNEDNVSCQAARAISQ